MSNKYDVIIAVRDWKTMDAITARVDETEDTNPDVQDVYDAGVLSQIRFRGKEFLCLEWNGYNLWAIRGGNALLDIVRGEAVKGDGFAFVSVDEFGEDVEVIGKDFEGFENLAFGMDDASLKIA